ncbi:unnamed protein product [Owenia fusiformis]|uniref:Fucosyltransferase n=1 Tax=Owenia fusiformis TaxID=6347 RepID=A0A8J1UC07_OWEFU|nr:unnamed protein product [Owenia fusiformis]
MYVEKQKFFYRIYCFIPRSVCFRIRQKKLHLLFGGLLLLLIYYQFNNQIWQRPPAQPRIFSPYRMIYQVRKSEIPPKPDVIKVLAWSPLANRHFSDDTFRSCSQPNCKFLADRSVLMPLLKSKALSPIERYKLDLKLLQKADVVLFHALSDEFRRAVIPPMRTPWQKWVFTTAEAPRRDFFQHADYAKWRHLMNLTVTIKADADKQLIYGYYSETLEIDPGYTLPDYFKRTGLVAWAASHCKTESYREQFIEKLQNFIPVDTYGRCGKHPCPGNDVEDCFYYIGSRYKFYLALENSDCPDYITEKSWRNSLTHNLVPIVRGKLNNYRKYLPPGSYIHTDNFESIEQLARHLLNVSQNRTLYESYFTWKFKYEVHNRDTFMDLCSICEVVHDTWDIKQSWDLDNWWSPDQCLHNQTDYLA